MWTTKSLLSELLTTSGRIHGKFNPSLSRKPVFKATRNYRDKKLESWVKDLGGGGRGEPTIVTPKQCRCCASRSCLVCSPVAVYRQNSLQDCYGAIFPFDTRQMVQDRNRSGSHVYGGRCRPDALAGDVLLVMSVMYSVSPYIPLCIINLTRRS